MQTVSAAFEPVPASVGAARRHAVDALSAAGVHDLQDDVRTVVSELATNAVLHARTPFTVTLLVDDAGVRIAVSDASPTRARILREGDKVATTGRGLRIVARLSTTWGVEPDGVGKTTWCELAASAPEDATHGTGAAVRGAQPAVRPPSNASARTSAASAAPTGRYDARELMGAV